MFRRRPRTADELYREGRALDPLGHERKAAALYEQAAAAGHGPACNELGKRRVRAGKTIEGLQLLRRALDAGVPEAGLNLAAVHTRRGQTAKAQEFRGRAEPALRDAAAAGDLSAALALRRLYRDRDEPDAAAAVVAAAEERAAGSDDPDVWCGLGALLDDAGRTADAEPWLRRAAEAGHVESMYLLGLVLGSRGEPWLERAARKDNAYAMDALAQLARERGDRRAAERWSRRSARLRGESESV